MAMVAQKTFRRGAAAGLLTAAGAEFGKSCLIGLTFAGLTISGRLQPELHRRLPLAAALYLVWRAGNMLRCRFRAARKSAASATSRPIVDGLSVGFGNPTAFAVFAAFLPQFTAAGGSTAAPALRMGGSYLCVAHVFHLALAAVVSCIRVPGGSARIGGMAELASVVVYLGIATAAAVEFLNA